MLENMSLDALIEQQIKTAIDQRVQAVLDQTDWIDQLESRVAKFAQDRIIARFSNISTVPDLVTTVENSVAQLFDQGRIPDLATFVDPTKLTNAVDSGIQALVDSTISNLVLDPAWINKIEQIVNQNMAHKFSKKLADVDVNSLILQAVDAGVERWQDRLKQDFRTHGISDQAQNLELTVMDGIVVVEKDLATTNLHVNGDAEVLGDLTVNNLIVTGVINTDNQSWDELGHVISQKVLASTTDEWRKELVDQVLEQAKTGGIQFDAVTVGSQPLIKDNTLSASVVDSNLQSTGVLKKLSVDGPVRFGQTMHVGTRRVGINTQEPEMALSVWDEEVSIIAGKLSKQQAFVGTARLQSLAFGVNRVPQIEIDVDGLTTIKQLRLGRHRISHANSVPGYSGTRGDLVFNSDPKPGTPFAWVCLGSFQWQSLHSTQ